MTTFLQLCQTVRTECGVAGDGLPSSVTNQTGVMKKIVDRTARAWSLIQSSAPTWQFMRAQKTFALTSGVRTYSRSGAMAISSFGRWDYENLYIFDDSVADQTNLKWMTYSDFRRKYRDYGSGRPQRFIDLNGTVQFERTPDSAYTLTLDYFTAPVILAANGDVPAIPDQFTEVIVWRSVMLFAGNEEASNLYTHAKLEYDKLFKRLLVEQGDLPGGNKDHPIALGTRSTSTW
jgi:hypothetical protein